MAGKKWGLMTDEEKKPFAKKSDDDKVRHDKQVAEREKKGFFTLEDKSKSTDPDNAKLFKKRKSHAESESDEECKELKPKRPLSAYIFFATEHSAKLRAAHPEIKNTEVMGMAGKKWNEMNEAQKKPFETLNAKDKIRHEKQLASLEKNGYFTLDDGSKSNDEKNVPTHKRRLSKAKQSLPSDHEDTKPVRKSQKKASVSK